MTSSANVVLLLIVIVSTGYSLRTFIDRLEQCENDNATLSIFKKVKFDRSTTASMQTYDLELHVGRQLNVKKVSAAVDLQKCSTEDENSCAKFPSLKFKNVCDLFKITSLPVKDLLECLDEKVVNCVFKKRVYKGKNCKLQMEKFKMFPLEGSFWRAQISLSQKESHVMCLFAMVHLK